MIEKITNQNQIARHKLAEKINELIDVVNELQKDYDNVCVWVGEQNLKTPAENVLTKSLRMDKEFAEDECARLQAELDCTRKALSNTIKLAEEMLESIEDEGMCSEYYEDELNKIKSITKGGNNE